MKFKVDENLPATVASRLRQAGHDAETVLEQGHSGATDAFLAEACREGGRVLVTLDLGFGNVRTYPPSEHAGFVLFRPSAPSVTAALELVELLLGELDRSTPQASLG
ncbi:MAG: DUF5615 family PIN-like protein [Candidatus Sumerlaeia bacterium]|nr:DUF5615 family PIN-like protein [Candidatus Sumerlaeia bacterium]